MVATATRKVPPLSKDDEDAAVGDGLVHLKHQFCPSCSSNLVLIDLSQNQNKTYNQSFDSMGEEKQGNSPVAEVPFCTSCNAHVVSEAYQVEALMRLAASGDAQVAHKGAILVSTPSALRDKKKDAVSSGITPEHELMIELFQAATVRSTVVEEVEMALVPEDENLYLTIATSGDREDVEPKNVPMSPLRFLNEHKISTPTVQQHASERKTHANTQENSGDVIEELLEEDDELETREPRDSAEYMSLLGSKTNSVDDDLTNKLFGGSREEAVEGIEMVHCDDGDSASLANSSGDGSLESVEDPTNEQITQLEKSDEAPRNGEIKRSAEIIKNITSGENAGNTLVQKTQQDAKAEEIRKVRSNQAPGNKTGQGVAKGVEEDESIQDIVKDVEKPVKMEANNGSENEKEEAEYQEEETAPHDERENEAIVHLLSSQENSPTSQQESEKGAYLAISKVTTSPVYSEGNNGSNERKPSCPVSSASEAGEYSEYDSSSQESSHHSSSASSDGMPEDYIPEYTIRREIATKVLGAMMLQGHTLKENPCRRCEMPKMDFEGKETCVVCPFLRKRAVKAKLQQQKATLLDMKVVDHEKEDATLAMTSTITTFHETNFSASTSTCDEKLAETAVPVVVQSIPRADGEVYAGFADKAESKADTEPSNPGLSKVPSADGVKVKGIIINRTDSHGSNKSSSNGVSSKAASADAEKDLSGSNNKGEKQNENLTDYGDKKVLAEDQERGVLSMNEEAKNNQGTTEEAGEKAEWSDKSGYKSGCDAIAGTVMSVLSPSPSNCSVSGALASDAKVPLSSTENLPPPAQPHVQNHVFDEWEEEANEMQKEAAQAMEKAKIALEKVKQARLEMMNHVSPKPVQKSDFEILDCTKRNINTQTNSSSFSQDEAALDRVESARSSDSPLEKVYCDNWENLRCEGRLVKARRMLAGWQETDRVCAGRNCNKFPLITNGKLTECLVCGGCGDGTDGVYDATSNNLQEGFFEPKDGFYGPTTDDLQGERAVATDGFNEATTEDLQEDIVVPKKRKVADPEFYLNGHRESGPLHFSTERSIKDLQKDFESKRNIVCKEIGQRMTKGWTLLDKVCPYCVMPLMTNKKQRDEICVLCGVVSKHAPLEPFEITPEQTDKVTHLKSSNMNEEGLEVASRSDVDPAIARLMVHHHKGDQSITRDATPIQQVNESERSSTQAGMNRDKLLEPPVYGSKETLEPCLPETNYITQKTTVENPIGVFSEDSINCRRTIWIRSPTAEERQARKSREPEAYLADGDRFWESRQRKPEPEGRSSVSVERECDQTVECSSEEFETLESECNKKSSESKKSEVTSTPKEIISVSERRDNVIVIDTDTVAKSEDRSQTQKSILTLEIPTSFNIEDEGTLKDLIAAAKAPVQDANSMYSARKPQPSPGMVREEPPRPPLPSPGSVASRSSSRPRVTPESAPRPRTPKIHPSYSRDCSTISTIDESIGGNQEKEKLGGPEHRRKDKIGGRLSCHPPLPRMVQTKKKKVANKRPKDSSTSESLAEFSKANLSNLPIGSGSIDDVIALETLSFDELKGVNSDVVSVGSATLDALMTRIEEAKCSLEGNQTDNDKDQPTLKELIEGLAAAAREMEMMEK